MLEASMNNQPIPGSAGPPKPAFCPDLRSQNQPKNFAQIQKRTHDIAIFDIEWRNLASNGNRPLRCSASMLGRVCFFILAVALSCVAAGAPATVTITTTRLGHSAIDKNIYGVLLEHIGQL